MKRIGFKNLFEDLDSCDQFPIEKFADNVPSLFRDFSAAAQRYCHLDFSGIEQLTDEVFFVLQEKLNPDQRQSVTIVDLTGCVHITDAGIRIMSELFSELKEILLVGASALSSQSLHHLRIHCKQLKSVNMDASGISCVPKERLPFQVSLKGCPLITSEEISANHVEKKCTVDLIIIVVEEFRLNVSHWLRTGKVTDIKPKEFILYEPRGWKLGDTDVNIIEVHGHSVFLSAFIHPRSLFLIVLNTDSQQQPQLPAMMNVDYIRAEVPEATILILALSTANEAKDKFKSLDESLHAMFKDQRDNIKEHLEKEHYSKSVDKDFANQRRYVQSIETSRPENFTIHLIGLNVQDVENANSYHQSVIQENKATDMGEKLLARWNSEYMNDAKDSLNRLNKSDMAEVLSLRNWPAVLTYVIKCALVIMREEEDPLNFKKTVNSHMSDYRFILKLQHYDLMKEKEPSVILKRISMLEKPEDVDKISAISRFGASVWLWVQASIVFYEEISVYFIGNDLDQANQADATKGKRSNLDLVRNRLLENCRYMNNCMYQWFPKMIDSRIDDFLHNLKSQFSQQKIILYNHFLKTIKYEPYSAAFNCYFHALDYLTITGEIVHFSRTKCHCVILDIAWFVRQINSLIHQWTNPLNQDKFIFLPFGSPLTQRNELVSLLQSIDSDAGDSLDISTLLDLFVDLGAIMSIPDHRYTPSIFRDNSKIQNDYLSPWHAVPSRPHIRTGLQPDQVDTSMSSFMKDYFPYVNSPEFNREDLCMKYSVKFRIGMPCNFFPQFVTILLRRGVYCLALWDQGIFFSHGTVDILVRHNFHGTLASSSIDIEARSARVSHYGSRLSEYFMSALGDYMTIVEGISHPFPHTHHKLRYYCLGECFQELGIENTFSPTEITKTLERNIKCSKCKRYQMSPKEWQFMIGRQFVFPSHAYCKNKTLACDKCWRTHNDVNQTWEYQCRLLPSFATFCFQNNAELIGCKKRILRGNLLLPPIKPDENSTLVVSHKTTRPLRFTEFNSVSVTVLKTTGIHLRICLDVSATTNYQSFPSDATDSMRDLVSMNVTEGTLQFAPDVEFVGEKRRGSLTSVKVKCGDVIQVDVVALRRVDSSNNTDSHIGCFKVKLSINHNRLESFFIPENCYFFVDVAGVSSEEERIPIAILSSPSYPIITARYFRPGMLLLYKTGIGAMWNPGLVTAIERGKLKIKHADEITAQADGRDPNAEKWYAPWSEELVPLGLYPDEMNAVVYTKHVKNMEDWYRFLKDNLDYFPAPFGLFPRLQNDFRFKPLPILTSFSRVCTTAEHSSWNYLRIIVTLSSVSVSMSPTLALPQTITIKSLMLRNRSQLQSSKGKALYQLCPGISWIKNIRDMHPLNVPPMELNESDYKDYRQEFHLAAIGLLKELCGRKSEVVGMLLLQNIDKCLPLIDPEMNRFELGVQLLSLCKMVRDDFVQRRVMAMPNLGARFTEWSGALDFDLQETPKKNGGGPSPRRPMSSLRRQDSVIPNRNSKFNQVRLGMDAGVCESHVLTRKSPTLDSLGAYNECVEHIRLSRVKINHTAFPSRGILSCKYLTRFELFECQIQDLAWLERLPQGNTLMELRVINCGIKKISKELLTLKSSLRHLFLTGNPIKMCPEFLSELGQLETLCLSNTLIEFLPENFGDLKRLKSFFMEKSILKQLPTTFENLKNLVSLKLGGVNYTVMQRPNVPSESITLKQWTMWCADWKTNGMAFNLISKEEAEIMFSDFDDRKIGELTEEKSKLFCLHLFNKYPRLCQQSDQEFPEMIFKLTELRTLVVTNTGIKCIPSNIRRLQLLSKMILDFNPFLETLEAEVGLLNLQVLSLKHSNAVKTPPLEIRNQGMAATIGYLNRLATGKTACYRTKLMLVGLGGAGKTSLIRAFMSESHRAPVLDGESITDGIDITTWSKRAPIRTDQGDDVKEEQTITYSVWDFAGQTLYYNTHQFFLTSRAIYFLIWNIRQGYEHAGLEFWLNSISCHAPTAPIFVVGTHADQVSKAEVPMKEMLKKFPSIVKFSNISCLTGAGVSELLSDLIMCTIRQPYIGEAIPEVWLKFERDLISERSKKDYLEWQAVQKIAKNNAIYDQELLQVVRFLHDLGNIQHFNTDLLREYVIIKSQWLVDVMKCVVSVKNNVIQDGQLHHSDVAKVWHEYSPHLHDWLLRMTEIFDLTFPMNDQPINIVPCLLPHNEPRDLNWTSDISQLGSDIREAKMLYKFDYLPAGLFNRLQVRLCQYSDTFNIWQRGSLLVKNNHKALIRRIGNDNITVLVQGVRPENFLLVIHETFEGLVQESFNGVHYEYLLPCTKCIHQQVAEPHLFSSLTLRRAVELRSHVLQCHVNFHFLSVHELQTMMPSEQVTDYDKQFERQLNDLIAVEDGVIHNVMIIHCAKDIKNAIEHSKDLVNPTKLADDLKKTFSVYFEPDLASVEYGELLNELAKAQTVLHLISDTFVEDKLCSELFRLSREELKKPIHLAIFGAGRTWQTSAVGAKITGDKYVNFQRMNTYNAKLSELQGDITTSLAQQVKKSDLPDPVIFLSYCWTNSLKAVACGDCKVRKESALGFGDPREIKEFLEKENLVTWIDVERMGANNLYSEICNALKKCKVMVACVSDDYALSEMCRKEFLFAMKALQMPLVIAIVGKSNNWESTEIGFSAIDYPRVDFQVANDGAYNRLLQLVKEKIDESNTLARSRGEKITEIQLKEQAQAFKEQYELLQRRLFRYLISYEKDEELYPRIFVVDYYKNTEREDDDLTDELPVDIADIKEINSNQQQQHQQEDDDKIKASEGIEYTANAEFCFKVLCEHEGGWHTVHDGYPIDLIGPDAESLLHLSGPYLARICRVLKHGGTNLSFVLNNIDGARFSQIIEANIGTFGMFETTYKIIRAHLRQKDVFRTRGGLKRCHLPSGKILWLCPQHQSLPRVTLCPDSLQVSGEVNSDVNNTIAEEFELKETVDVNNQRQALPDAALLKQLKEHFVSTPVNLLPSTNEKGSSLEMTNESVESGGLDKNLPSTIIQSVKRPTLTNRSRTTVTKKNESLKIVVEEANDKPTGSSSPLISRRNSAPVRPKPSSQACLIL